MSRRASNHQHHFALPENTVCQVLQVRSRPIRPPYTTHHHHQQQKRCPPPRSKHPSSHHPQTTIDIGFSDATTTDDTGTAYYDYCERDDGVGFHHSPLRESRNTDVTFSDDSGSTRLPYFEFDDESNKGTGGGGGGGRVYSRNSFSERSFRHQVVSGGGGGGGGGRYYAQQQAGGNDGGRGRFPEKEEQWEERMYHEIQTPCDNMIIPTSTNVRRIPPSRLSDRPQSSMSSALTTAMVYGCGGKCQTFESICYFVLQLVFTMGILVGVSLCIAGLVLRKSAARNLQVLVYIGILMALVNTLLLTIQCRAKNTARRRIKAIQTAKRAPIQMETLNIRTNPMQNFERHHQGFIRESQRQNQLPQVHHVATRPLPQRPRRIGHQSYVEEEEEQGIPWWRRKDLGK